jgi:hypothetical protein
MRTLDALLVALTFQERRCSLSCRSAVAGIAVFAREVVDEQETSRRLERSEA